jgi:hypothetical protein
MGIPRVYRSVRHGFAPFHGQTKLPMNLKIPKALNIALRQLAYLDQRSLSELVTLGIQWVVTEWAAKRDITPDVLAKQPPAGGHHTHYNNRNTRQIVLLDRAEVLYMLKGGPDPWEAEMGLSVPFARQRKRRTATSSPRKD